MSYVKDDIRFERVKEQAAYQHNHYLYLLGGKNVNYEDCLIRKDKDQNFRKCCSMRDGRSGVGFSGLNDFLFAVGGENQYGILKSTQKYTISTNKWIELPRLLQERKWPGLCCFEELGSYYQLFCFCGVSVKKLKSIEKYDVIACKWTKFEKDDGTIGNYNLRALPYKEEILVFGGASIEGKVVKSMYLFKQSGKIQKKILENEFIPIKQGEQPYFKDKYDRIFVVQEEREKEQIWMYEGREWIKVA